MSRPNVLVIHADQHRADCIGAYGNEQVKTPHLDSLSKDGVTFTQSFCTFPVCTPSRYSTLSGQYVWQHKGWSNCSTLHQNIPTFPKSARDAEYKTAAVGKMHFTPTYLDVGFDEMYLCEQAGAGRWDDDYHRYLMKRDLCDINDMEDQLGPYRRVAPKDQYWETCGVRPSNLTEEHHSTTWIADKTLEQIEKWSGSGNLLMTGFVKPHHPFDPPGKWAEMYSAEDMEILSGWTENFSERNADFHKGFFPHKNLSEGKLKVVMAAYYALISQIDYQIGRIIDKLKEKKIYDNTMIVYTSDHGDYVGHQHMILKGNLMYDPVVRVPLIIKYPSGQQSGRVYDQQVSGVDVATTILNQIGSGTPNSMAGMDLFSNFEGRKYVFAEQGTGSYLMVRTLGRKLILDQEHNPLFLFDLKRDPHELQNVLEDSTYREDLKELTQAAWDWRKPDDVSSVFLDDSAPTINQPNAPKDFKHRPTIKSYFQKKMAEAGYKLLTDSPYI